MDLAGDWTGSYIYPGELEPVPFHAEIRDHQGQLSGIVVEPANAWAATDEAHAVLTGERQGTAVTFTKIYDEVEAYPDPVAYEGLVDSEGCEISGTWRISPNWSGSFIMTRPRKEQAEVEAKEAAEV